MILQVLLSIVCTLVAYFLFQYKKIIYRFEAGGLKYLPGVPIFGNVWKSTFLKRHIIDDLNEAYDAFPDERYVGFADGLVPVILVRDPELIKTIVVKDFAHFQNKKEFFPVRLDSLLGRNLSQLHDEEWKRMRSKLTPAFTGAKLRHMLPIMSNVSKNIVYCLKNHTYQELELTEFMYRYAGDAVMASAFGINQDTAGKDESVFFKVGYTIDVNAWRRALIFISRQFPTLGEAIKKTTGFQLFPKDVHEFLRKVVTGSLAHRKENNLTIPDYMDVLSEISEEYPIDDLAAQVFFSFLASSETGSSILRFCFHELTLHPNIQEQLYQEIRKHEDMKVMTLESINGLKYLDCVFTETSRKWSPALIMDRICTKPYLLPPPREGGKPYLVNPGHMIFNVVNAINTDPKFYENPEMFDPERFSEENKHNVKWSNFTPFGIGPRACLAARFMTLEVKVMIYYMVLNFKLVRCEKTTDPIELIPDDFNLKAVGGTWMRLEPRE